MAKIPLPERGQPLDVAYIYQIGNAVNQLSDQVSSATYNYTTIDTKAAGKQSIKTSEARVVGGRYVVANNSTVTATSTKDFTYQFGNDFKYPPIATVSVVNSGRTQAGENVTVVVTEVTNSTISGIVRFNENGNVSAELNIILIGIPN